MLLPARGTRDLLPDEFAKHEFIVQTAKSIGRTYGFQEMNIPIFEYTEVFDRSLGELSDVVNKEMYTFADKSNRSITLRPEFTAGIMRAVLSGNLQHELPLRFFSNGPLFRYDRPMSGRYRQFHQINFEYLGVFNPWYDAELLKLCVDITNALGIANKVTLEINSLGCSKSRNDHKKDLTQYFNKYKDKLSDLSKLRLTKNPLRIFDSKEEQDQEICENAPLIKNYYTKESEDYFNETLSYLEAFGIQYQVNPKLVRGLDYYSHTIFEFIAAELGAQSTVFAGGRYDGLSMVMQRPKISAIGVSGGIERLSMIADMSSIEKQQTIVVFPIDQKNIAYAFKLADDLRNNGIVTIIDIDGKIGKRIQKANKKNIKFAIFIGDEEEQNQSFKVKNLNSSEETIAYSMDALLNEIQ